MIRFLHYAMTCPFWDVRLIEGTFEIVKLISFCDLF